MDVLVMESEYRKNEQKKIQLDMKINQAKKKIEFLKIELEKDKLDLGKIISSQAVLAGEIKKIKKNLGIMK